MSEQERGDDQPSPRIIWWERLEPAVTPRYEFEDFVTDEDFDMLVTDGGRGERRQDDEGLDPDDFAPPSEENDHCGNCWRPKGETSWCPHCEIYRNHMEAENA